MKDIIPAFCAGLTEVIIGHPFDTIKVLIQNKKTFSGLKFKSYYRGWKYPLYSSILFNCTVFPVNEIVKTHTKNTFFAGLLTGLACTPVVFASNTYKIRKQNQQKVSLKTLKTYNGLSGIFLRETIAMSFYFGCYDYLRKKNYNSFVSGGFAGVCCWTISYPFDVIQSRQISQQISMKKAFNQGKLWRGYNICVARAMVTNSFIFSVYEKLKKF
tara:strand:+ start:1891 stop:2532 length:642 start_codon:yes stop_codon:yes gene_type:complete